MDTITKDIKAILDRKLPDEAVSPHPSKTYLSCIKSIYVTERLNEAFGAGAWQTKVEHITTDKYLVKRKIDGKDTMVEQRMVVVKLQLDIPSFGIHYESFGGNDNEDLGDAYKGAATDALTKIGSWLGIGADVFKGLQTGKKGYTKPAQPTAQPKPRKVINDALLDNRERLDKMLSVLDEAYRKNPATFAVIKHLRDDLGFEFENHAEERVMAIWMQHIEELN